MNKVLLVSWGVHPMPSGSAVILDNIATQFSKSEMVLLGEHQPNKTTENWIEDWPKIHYVNYNLSIAGKGMKYFRWFNFFALVKRIEQVYEEEKCTCILAVFPDEFYTYAAYKVAVKRNIPFYTWFHNTYLDNREGVLLSLAKKIQPKIFDLSRVIFTMSQGMNDFCQMQYPQYHQKFVPLLHGFDVPENVIATKVEIERPVRFLLTGNINRSNTDATMRLVEAIFAEDQTNELHIYGNNPASFWKGRGFNDKQIFVHGFIPLADLVRQFEEYDIMLLPHGFDGGLSEIEYLTIFPTRTIPLLYSGKPILGHMPPNTAITKMLENKKCALLVKEKSISQLIESIKKLIDSKSLREQLVNYALQASKDYDVRNTAQQLKKEIFS